MPDIGPARVTLDDLRLWKRRKRKFAMLTAYDFPMAAIAEAAGAQSLLIGDSMGTVLLGHENTRRVPLELMLILGEAVRRGAPRCFLVGDLPYESIHAGPAAVRAAAQRFVSEAGCDAVKIETGGDDAALVEAAAAVGTTVMAHLGLRPQQVVSANGYRAQARDSAGIDTLVHHARRMCNAGAACLLLEAVPNEASCAVLAATDVPVIGCGAGPACDGHVVVTQDLLGISTIRPPRFVPVLAQLGHEAAAAMRTYVQDVESGRYPAPQHAYPMRSDTVAPAEAQ